jgi:hypothetical protein
VAALVCHPQTPSQAVQEIAVAAARAAGGLLALSYSIRGDLSRLAVPAARRPAPGARLWQHTCCEAFLAQPSGAAYREYNFSPSGEWAAYAFERYREGAAVDVPDPRIELRSTLDELELRARIELAPGKMLAALCAVIEEAGGGLSYWALRHPPGKPDFHHPAGFALEID